MLNHKYFMSERATTMRYTKAINFLKAAIGICPQNKNTGDKELMCWSTFPTTSFQRCSEDSFSLTVSKLQSTSIHVFARWTHFINSLRILCALVNSSLIQSNLFSFSVDFFPLSFKDILISLILTGLFPMFLLAQ